MEKYLFFELEDFVVDNDFIQWVISPTEDSSEKWNNFLLQYPDKKEVILQSVQIVRSLEPVEEEISMERIRLIWRKVQKNHNQPRLLWAVKFSKYAAIFVIAFLLGFGSFLIFQRINADYTNQYTEIKVPYGERSEVTLYDGTKVWLNSGTVLKFPLVFKTNQRKVFVQGEAFFDVAKNKEKPFIVDANQMEIQVFGTRFNICAYPDDNDLYTTLEEGKIAALNNITGEKVQLKPGEQAVLNIDTKKMTIQTVNTELYTSWKDNLLRFEDAEFSDVVKKMERWYDVKMIVDKSINSNKRYTMTIKTESLREMLRLLSFTTPMKYEINEDQVFIHRP